MSDVTATSSEKAVALKAVQRMLDSATLEEICEELAILTAMRRGEADIAAGRLVSHEDVKLRSAAWTSK